MSQRQDYEAKLAEAEALKKEDVKSPYMKVEDFIEDSKTLSNNAFKHKEKLLTAGITEELLQELKILTSATLEAESNWSQVRETQKEAQIQWNEKKPEAVKLKRYLLKAGRYALRKDKAKQNTVDLIAAGDSNADLIQDLNDLAVLGRQNTEAFNKIGVSPDNFEKAAALAAEMLELRARANGENEICDERIIRDRFYTLLKEVADEVRDCARFVFYDDEGILGTFQPLYYN
jgi:hypothetical protein